ncbi:MAG: hypothetical protein ACYTEO_04750 [Planctomycetota bacterium]|jgi:hypothetical protein
MKKLMMVLMGDVLLAAVPAVGGPLVKSRVSGSANWVAHVDIERFNSTQIGRLIREDLKNQGVEGDLKNFANVFSFHPLDDVLNVTIYGQGQKPEKAVVLIEGKFNREQLLTVLRFNPSYEEAKYGDIVIHSWVDEKKQDPNDSNAGRMYGCFYNDELIVMGAGQEAVKQAMDVLNGTAGNAATGVFNQAELNAKGALFTAAANKVGEVVGEEPEAAVLKEGEQLGLAVGETESKFYIDLSLTVKSEEAAQAISKIADGIIALAALGGEEQPGLAEMAKMTKLSCEGKTVKVHFEADSQAAFLVFQEQWKVRREKESQTQ